MWHSLCWASYTSSICFPCSCTIDGSWRCLLSSLKMKYVIPLFLFICYFRSRLTKDRRKSFGGHLETANCLWISMLRNIHTFRTKIYYKQNSTHHSRLSWCSYNTDLEQLFHRCLWSYWRDIVSKVLLWGWASGMQILSLILDCPRGLDKSWWWSLSPQMRSSDKDSLTKSTWYTNRKEEGYHELQIFVLQKDLNGS